MSLLQDVADIWGFCCRMGKPIGAALDNADSKAAGLFPPDLARRLLGTTIDDWRLVRWIGAPVPTAYLADHRVSDTRRRVTGSNGTAVSGLGGGAHGVR